MSEPTTIPVAWLSPFPPGHRHPFWKWLLLPASTFLAHRNRGVWISGTLKADEAGLSFAPTRMAARGRGAGAWTLPWAEIGHVEFAPGMALDRTRLHHSGGVLSLQSARSSAFFDQVRARVERSG